MNSFEVGLEKAVVLVRGDTLKSPPIKSQRGSPKSGYHRPHKGRPGQIGGSAPRDAGADGELRPTGQCYYTASRWMMENAGQIDNARLAHGTVTGQGPIEGVPFGHAWIEIGDAIVIDTERGLTLLKEQYYRVGQITDVALYTYEEMLKEMLKHEHYGPWHEGAARSGRRRSYPAPHYGRPGQVGGSRPREEGEQPLALSEMSGRVPEGEDTTTKQIDEWLIEGLPVGFYGDPPPDWAHATVDQRGYAKEEIVAALHERTGLPKKDISAFIEQWSRSSNDDDMRSLAIQRDAAELFGMPLSTFTTKKIEAIGEACLQATGLTLEEAEHDPWMKEKGQVFVPLFGSKQQKLLLQAMYDNTQERLAGAGFKPGDKIRLRRGVRLPIAATLDWRVGDHIDVVGNTLESWTIGADEASDFARRAKMGEQMGALFEMDVPVEWVVGSARSGFGCLIEGEFVILGSLPSKAKLLRLYVGR